MTPAFTHYDRIRELQRENPVYLVTKNEVPNKYSSDGDTTVPAMSLLRSEFGCDSGLYARYDDLTTGVTQKCLIDAESYDQLVFWDDLTVIDLLIMNFLISASK